MTYKTLEKWLQSRKISQGRHRGKNLKLLTWQKKFLRAFLNPDHVTLALSMGRGNGKSCFLGAMAAAAIGGPLAQPRADVFIVASTFNQGCVLFDFATDFLGEDDRFKIYRSSKTAQAKNLENNSNLVVLAPDIGSLQGKAGLLWLCDEPSAWVHTRAEQLAGVIETSLGKIPDSKAVYLGTRPAFETHFYQRLLDGEADFALSYQTEKHLVDNKPLNWRSIRQANPSLDHLPDLKSLLDNQRKRARKDENFLQTFKSWRLNGGVPPGLESLILEASSWQRIEGEAPRKGKSVWGIDLSASYHLSAVCSFWESGRLEAVAACPKEPNLATRGLKDGVGTLYQRMADRQELIQAGLRIVDVSELLRVALEKFGKPSRIICDSYRYNALVEALTKAEIPFVPVERRRWGWGDGTEDLSQFRKAALSDPPLVTPVKSLLLRSSLAAARTASDSAGNQKMGKKPVGMDDALAAAILAVSSGTRSTPRKNRIRYFAA